MTDDHRYALPAGYRLGDYRIEQVLGHGGFGITYLARASGSAGWWRSRNFCRPT